MNARVRLLLSFGLTAVILGSGVLTWGSRTGQFTIFGDSNQTINADLTVTSAIDLQKGVDAGDHHLTVNPTGSIGLVDGATSGTALFTLGQREITAIDRVVPILTDSLPASGSLTLSFAGSADGVSFNDFSPAQPVATNTTDPTGVPIPLDFLIPTQSRFLRVELTISRTNLADTPTLAGFTMNYNQLAPATTGAVDETVLVNGSPANATGSAPLPGRPASLVVTGNESWLIWLGAIWLIGLWFIWTRKGGNGRTASSS